MVFTCDELDITMTEPRCADEYKFVCAHGEPVLCEYFPGLSPSHELNVLTVPGFRPLFEGRYSTDGLASEDRLAEMTKYARRLSDGHGLMRVDFYHCHDEIYGGELTLTPGASLSLIPGEGVYQAYSDIIVSAMRRRLGIKHTAWAGIPLPDRRVVGAASRPRLARPGLWGRSVVRNRRAV
jgi:hypothetical protein